MIVVQVLFFLVVALLANISYKGKTFISPSWRTSYKIAGMFLISCGLLLSAGKDYMTIEWPEWTLVPLILTTIAWFLAPVLVHKYGRRPTAFIQNNPDRFLVRFELSAYFIKYFEVLFQQVGFLYIIFVLFETAAYEQRVVWFTIFVALFHLANLLFMGAKQAMFYFALSIPMAFVFGNMILQGLSLVTFSIHLLFYLAANAYHWLNGKKR